MSESTERITSISYQQLSTKALRGVIEAFVLQEGTDYGEKEYNLETKVAQVLAQLESNEAEIVFDTVDESCSIRIKGRAEVKV